MLDVRDPQEYESGHPSGFASAPGGQLVQATDGWVGVRGARIVLYDDDGVRARMAASWLLLSLRLIEAIAVELFLFRGLSKARNSHRSKDIHVGHCLCRLTCQTLQALQHRA